jgi:zinc transport system substrate-binding protein
MRCVILVFMMLLGSGLQGCAREESNASTMAIDDVVRTTSAPVHALATQISSGLVPVELLCPTSQDPAAWRPSAETVAQYQRARLVVTSGAGYEGWVQTAPLPRSRVIEAASGLSEPLLIVRGETHSHGPAGDHTHEVTLGHVWIDPLHAIEQARAVSAGMITAFPEHEQAFNENLGLLIAELQTLHQRLVSVDVSSIDIIAPQRPYGYLARRYGWISAEIGTDPSSWSMDLYAMQLSRQGRSQEAAILLCEQMPADSIAEQLLQEHGVRLVRWETCTLGCDGSLAGELGGNITRLAEAIADSLP